MENLNEKLNPASPMTQREESVLSFTDSSRNLFGRISIFKINFKKNLRRFQDIGNECALQELRLTQFVDSLLNETPLPTIWSCNLTSAQQSTKKGKGSSGQPQSRLSQAISQQDIVDMSG